MNSVLFATEYIKKENARDVFNRSVNRLHHRFQKGKTGLSESCGV